MGHETPYSVPETRALSSEETALVKWLLERVGEAGAPFVQQLAKLRVESRCGCLACPTVGFSVDGRTAPKSEPSKILIEAVGRTNEGAIVGVILFVQRGLISELEVYALSLEERWSLPRLDTLEVP